VVQSVSHKMLYTAVKENPKLSITVYPNPASDFIILQANTGKPISYTITDLLGKTILPMRAVTSEQTRINVSNWVPGIYIIKTNDGYSRKVCVGKQ